MTPSNYFPSHKIEGQHYRLEEPEIEFHGTVGVLEGPHLFIREHGEQDRLAEPEELLGVLLGIRSAFRENVANGNYNRIGMVIVPTVGGLALCRTGILKPADFTEKRVYEDDGIITVSRINLSDPLMNSWQSVSVGISTELEVGKVSVHTADGDEL